MRLVANELSDVYAGVRVCPVRQFNVQLYVEKVFIAQKTSEDRGGKLRKADKKKDTGKSLGYRFTEEELGGGRGYIECRIKKRGTDRWLSTRWRRHIARQGKLICATHKKKR